MYVIYVIDRRTDRTYNPYMTSPQQIITERGGIRPLARSLGHKNHTTVQGWWERNSIPDHHMAGVLAVPVAESPRAAA